MPRTGIDVQLAQSGTTLVLALVSLSGPVAGQSANRDLLDGLQFRLFAVGLAITVTVLAAFVYAAAFRDRDEGATTSEPETPALEVVWTVAAALVLVFAGVSGYGVLESPYVSTNPSVELDGGNVGDGELEDLESDDVDVHVRASQWEWEATYAEANVTTRGTLVVPADENVSIWLTSEDVVHALSVPELGLKRAAFPGEYTHVRTHPTEPGTYDARCTEFCGSGHAEMTATVVVLEPDAYESWLTAHAGAENASAPSDVG